MPNCFMVAKRSWEGADLVGAIQYLNECLERELAGPAFAPDSRIFDANVFARFETAVAAMLTDDRMRRTSFGQLYAAIWRWHPDQIWIDLLLSFNFFAHFDRFGFEKALVAPLHQLAGFDAIVEVLTDSCAKGMLAPEFEGPNSGRPALPLKLIEQVDEKRWGPLKKTLLQSLRECYAKTPADFWARLSAQEPVDVLIRFLHDLFGNYLHPLDVAELRWKAIGRDQPAYARAVLTSLQHVLGTCDDHRFLTEIVRFDAGKKSIEDGRQWLAELLSALQSSNFRDFSPNQTDGPMSKT